MVGDQRHLHDPAAAEKLARALGLMVGGHHPFVGDWKVKGLYAYRSGKYKGQAYFGTGGSESDRLKDIYNPINPGESNQKYRPWNRDDPKIPEDIRQKLIRWEDKNSIKVVSHEITETSRVFTPLRTGWYRIEHADGSLVERVRVHRGERSTSAPNEFIATGDFTGDVTWYVEGNEVNVPKFGSTGTIQSDGNITWGRDGNKAVYEGNASNPSTGNQSIRNDVGKIALKSVHGKYLSAQPDGRAEWNRTIANDWEFFELGERDGRKITLRSTHGKYVSAQPDGAVQINRDHAPPGGWEEFTVETRPGSTPGDAHDFLHLKSVHGFYLSAQADGTAQWNRDHAPPGGWEDIQFVPYSTQNQEPAPIKREESIEILEAVAGRPVRFKINNRPSSNDAWVGIYPPNARDQDHGAENNRWKWLRNIDVNNAAFRRQSSGPQSIRVFADGGYTLHARKDFNVSRAEPADSSSSKRRAVAAMGVGIILFTMGLPLLIMGSISTAEDRLAMLIPGAVLTSFGAFILFMSVAAVIRMGSVEKHSSVAGIGAADSDSTSLDVLLRAGSKEEVWMKEAEFDGQRLNGLIPDHRNNFTKKVTTSKIVAQDKVGNLTRFETGLTTYLVYDRDLQIQQNDENPFWDID